MEILLEEFYHNDLHVDSYRERKACILDEKSYQLVGVTQSGKTTLLKNYLLTLKKSSYLYIDCSDIRIDIQKLNAELSSFNNRNKIEVLVLDNYHEGIKFVNVAQLLISSQKVIKKEGLALIELYPLDYEEFLAYEHKYDSSALNHFFQLGGFPVMHKLSSDVKNLHIQVILQAKLDDMEFDILRICAKYMSQKLSAFTIYERLKLSRKISKDKLYKSFKELEQKRYIHSLAKFNHSRAIKKVYLCDISLKSALSIEKNFARLFENMVFLELLKADIACFYEDGVDFYLPHSEEIILCKPFMDERRLFSKLESLEEFIFTLSIKKITVITMNKEGSVAHPFSQVAMVPFDIWALGD